MSPTPNRPTTRVSDVILDSMDGMYSQLRTRLSGLSVEEYLWEPVDAAWSARPGPGSTVVIDGAGVRDIDPAPVTTIAWRLWHLAIDCFDDYTRRFAGDLTEAPPTWTMEAAEAIRILDEKWHAYRSVLSQRDWWEELGPGWGPWSRHCLADMAMHASNELVHHGAELALLRDLYRPSTPSPDSLSMSSNPFLPRLSRGRRHSFLLRFCRSAAIGSSSRSQSETRSAS